VLLTGSSQSFPATPVGTDKVDVVGAASNFHSPAVGCLFVQSGQIELDEDLNSSRQCISSGHTAHI
jgi:hypothetical protein